MQQVSNDHVDALLHCLSSTAAFSEIFDAARDVLDGLPKMQQEYVYSLLDDNNPEVLRSALNAITLQRKWPRADASVIDKIQTIALKTPDPFCRSVAVYTLDALDAPIDVFRSILPKLVCDENYLTFMNIAIYKSLAEEFSEEIINLCATERLEWEDVLSTCAHMRQWDSVTKAAAFEIIRQDKPQEYEVWDALARLPQACKDLPTDLLKKSMLLSIKTVSFPGGEGFYALREMVQVAGMARVLREILPEIRLVP